MPMLTCWYCFVIWPFLGKLGNSSTKWAGKGHHPVLSCVMSQHTTKNSCCLHSRDGGFPGTRHFSTQRIHVIYGTLVYHRLSIHKMNRLVVFPQSRSYPSHTDSVRLENTLQPLLFSPLELLYLSFFYYFYFFISISTTTEAAPHFC